jgi:beta-aspartyl-peptidase (threonine type)
MTPEKEKLYIDALSKALKAGWETLSDTKNSLDAVERAVSELEDIPLFNAGKGSVFSNSGKQEMDASIMSGSDLKAGCVAAVSNVKNPIKLARLIMENTDHVLLCGKEAEDFGKYSGIKFENDDYFFSQERYNQLLKAKGKGKSQLDHSDDNEKKYGTVGAVALDSNGNLASATSTGGMTNKKYGRIGDSPIIGAGTYASNKTCAVSCTGSGEYFMRAVTAYDVSCLMEYKGLTLEKACDIAINKKLKELGGDGGLIAVDRTGNIALPFNCEGMYRGWIDETGDIQVRIFRE